MPCFARPGRDDAPQLVGRLLLVSYHYPPSTEAGALRWQQLTNCARQRGWAVDVLTLHPDDLATRDDSRIDLLAPDTRVFGIPKPGLLIDRAVQWCLQHSLPLGRRPQGAGAPPLKTSLAKSEVTYSAGLYQVVRRAFFTWRWVAIQRAWSGAAARVGDMLCRQHDYLAVVSCGPPHWIHETADQLGRTHDLPFVADLRDPWSQAERLPEHIASPLWYQWAERSERDVLGRADLVVSNTGLAARALGKRLPTVRVVAVMNGYDDLMPSTSVTRTRYTISYAGTVYIDRNPRHLFRAARQVIDELDLHPDDFELEFIGHRYDLDGLTLEQIAAEEGVEDYVTPRDPMPRTALLDHLRHSSMLVSLPQDSHMAIPSKLFEYMVYQTDMLVLADATSASAELLKGTTASVCQPNDVPAIASAIRLGYQRFRQDVRPEPLAHDVRFSRTHQADILFDAINDFVLSKATGFIDSTASPAEPASRTEGSAGPT